MTIENIDQQTLERIAKLACMKISSEEAAATLPQFNSVLGFIGALSEVDVSSVNQMPMTITFRLRKRPDNITDGNCQDHITNIAPESVGGFLVVPKFVE